MPTAWPELPYDSWQATRDTLHAHTQVLGKLAAALAPPEPQLQHAALRLSARGWETAALPAPDGSGALVVALDLHALRGGRRAQRRTRAARSRSRPTARSARSRATLLAAVRDLAGPVELSLTPQETPWTTPLDEDDEHAAFDTARVDAYFAAATRAALVLGGAARALSRPLHARQRLVGLVRPRGEPLLGQAGRASGG